MLRTPPLLRKLDAPRVHREPPQQGEPRLPPTVSSLGLVAGERGSFDGGPGGGRKLHEGNILKNWHLYQYPKIHASGLVLWLSSYL